jgi:hypothetical protein
LLSIEISSEDVAWRGFADREDNDFSRSMQLQPTLTIALSLCEQWT